MFKDNYREFMIEVNEDYLHYRGKRTGCIQGQVGVGMSGGRGGGDRLYIRAE